MAEIWFGCEEREFPRNKMVTYILNAGIHGSVYNRQRHFVEEHLQTSGPFAGLKYCMARLFGNRKDLVLRYPVLQKHKILYPFCWFHRVFSTLRGKQWKHLRQEMQIVKHMEKGDAE